LALGDKLLESVVVVVIVVVVARDNPTVLALTVSNTVDSGMLCEWGWSVWACWAVAVFAGRDAGAADVSVLWKRK
jgi:hypothetical protein